jgi:hypothetical protein
LQEEKYCVKGKEEIMDHCVAEREVIIDFIFDYTVHAI